MLHPKTMSLEEAKTQLGNEIYKAAALIEQLEYAGRVDGNGHHMRQKVAEFAKDLLGERWRP